MPEAIVFRHPQQPVREHFCGVFVRHGTGKTQSALAQDALVRVGAQERFHQHREPRLLRLFAWRYLQCFVDFLQQRAAFAVGQEAVVALTFPDTQMQLKITGWITPGYLVIAHHSGF